MTDDTSKDGALRVVDMDEAKAENLTGWRLVQVVPTQKVVVIDPETGARVEHGRSAPYNNTFGSSPPKQLAPCKELVVSGATLILAKSTDSVVTEMQTQLDQARTDQHIQYTNARQLREELERLKADDTLDRTTKERDQLQTQRGALEMRAARLEREVIEYARNVELVVKEIGLASYETITGKRPKEQK